MKRSAMRGSDAPWFKARETGDGKTGNSPLVEIGNDQEDGFLVPQIPKPEKVMPRKVSIN